MGSVLDEVAAAADEVADDQRHVARRARAMQRRRDAGWSWARILDWEPEPGILELSRRSVRRLSDAVGGLAQTLASGLSAEGETRRQIGRRLTVSHQRITAMLKENGPKGSRREPDRDRPSPANR